MEKRDGVFVRDGLALTCLYRPVLAERTGNQEERTTTKYWVLWIQYERLKQKLGNPIYTHPNFKERKKR